MATDVGKRIRDIRNLKGIGQVELANKIDIDKQLLYKYENGVIINIPSDNIEKIAEALNVSPADIMGWSEIDIAKHDNILPIGTQKVPLLGDIAAGEPLLALNEPHEAYIIAGDNIKCDFCLKVKGNSMVNARINDGDIVFIRKQDAVEEGEIAAVLIDDEATLKRVFRTDTTITLVAENSMIPPRIISTEDHKDVRILGKAIAFQSDVK